MLQPRGPAAAIVLTDEQLQVLGGGVKTPAVRVTVNGHTFEGRVGRMRGESLVGFNRAVRQACGAEAGDEVDAEIVIDAGPRLVAAPEDLVAVLADDPRARAAFDGLAPSHRKEFVRWIEEAKKPETRARRVAATVEALREGRTRR